MFLRLRNEEHRRLWTAVVFHAIEEKDVLINNNE
jgi:hypothetical protein